MNMQAMLKQAQNMQKEMLKAKDEIDKKEFEGESSFVKVTLMGTKKVKKIEITADSLDKDDVEALEDMLLVAMNDAMDKIDNYNEEKMGKFANIPGLF